MISTVCTPDLLSELVCCPRCHGPIQAGPDGCPDCHLPCTQEGPVTNFLGQPGLLMPDGSDAAKAAWLLDHWRRWEGLPVGKAPSTYRHLAADLVTGDDLEKMISGSTFFQIVNDIRRIQDGTAAPSV